MLPQISCGRRFIFRLSPLDKLRDTGARSHAARLGDVLQVLPATKPRIYRRFHLQRTPVSGKSVAIALFAVRV
jgi:hypothetical protein